MPTIPERIETATAKQEAAATIIHNVANGPASGAGSTVTTDSGPVKTVAKMVADAESQASIDLAAAVAAATASATAQAGIATTQAEIATAQASAAGASAVLAQNAIAGAFKGPLAGNAVPATSALAGDTYRITTAGTSQGKTWVIGDAAIYNGTSGSWTQLTGFYLSTAYAEQLSTNRGALDWLLSDGVTTNRSQIQNPGARGNLALAPFASWVGWVEVPANGVGGNVFGLSNTTSFAGVSFRLECQITTAGMLLILQNGTLSGSDQRRREFSGFSAFAGVGSRGWLEIRFTNGTSDPVVRWNGVDITSSFSNNNLGAVPDWLPASLQNSFHHTGWNWPAGADPLGCWINDHMTNAESEAWRITGKPPVWVSAGGSMVRTNNSNFVNANGGGTLSAASQTAFTFVGAALTNQPVVTGLPNFQGGSKFRVSFSLTRNNGSTFLPTLQIAQSGVGIFSNITGATEGTNSFVLTTTASNNSGAARLEFSNNGSPDYTVSNFTVYPLGALSLPGVQTIGLLDDLTAIGGNTARLLGKIPQTQNRRWRAVGITATNGNQQLFGGDIFDSSRDVIEFAEQAPRTGTPTTSLGSASGGAQYKASGALAAGINPLTLVTRKLASNGVWVASNSTDEVVTTITGHRAGA